MSTSAERMRRMRARRAAGLLPPEGAPVLRDADDLLLPAVEATVEALGLGGTDAAAAQLARAYARAMDEARDPARAALHFGPPLLKVLEALRATPAARAGAKKPRPAPAGPNPVQRIRAEVQATLRPR